MPPWKLLCSVQIFWPWNVQYEIYWKCLPLGHGHLPAAVRRARNENWLTQQTEQDIHAKLYTILTGAAGAESMQRQHQWNSDTNLDWWPTDTDTNWTRLPNTGIRRWTAESESEPKWQWHPNADTVQRPKLHHVAAAVHDEAARMEHHAAAAMEHFSTHAMELVVSVSLECWVNWHALTLQAWRALSFWPI